MSNTRIRERLEQEGAFKNDDGRVVFSNTGENWEIANALTKRWIVDEENNDFVIVEMLSGGDADALVSGINSTSSKP